MGRLGRHHFTPRFKLFKRLRPLIHQGQRLLSDSVRPDKDPYISFLAANRQAALMETFTKHKCIARMVSQNPTSARHWLGKGWLQKKQRRGC